MSTASSTRIRSATASDVEPLARVHVAAWRETYAGMLPDTMLNGLSVEGRAKIWRQILTQASAINKLAVFVAENIDTGVADRPGELVGFCSCGEQRSATLKEQGYGGEISAVYVLRAAQRQGVGSALMRTMARTLLGQGHGAASLWVLRENTVARRYYERLGGEVVGQKQDDHEGVAVTEIAYGWRDVTGLERLRPIGLAKCTDVASFDAGDG